MNQQQNDSTIGMLKAFDENEDEFKVNFTPNFPDPASES